MRRHPLMRALRADKMTYAALESTLQEHAAGRAPLTVPVARMVNLTEAEIEARANQVIAKLPAGRLKATVVSGWSTVGGGSAPGSALPTRLIALAHPAFSAAQLEASLRASDPPVIARIDNELVLLDLRTVLPDQDAVVAAALARIDDSSF